MFMISNRLKSLSVLLVAFAGALPVVNGASYFVAGTYAGDTRYNVKKLFDGHDDNLCWAASASNVIDFWQARYTAYLPEGVPHGQSQLIYSSDVFYSFVHSFQDGGGFEEDGFSWWLNGTFMHKNYNMRTPQLSYGGYYTAWGWDSSDYIREVKIHGGEHVLFDVLFDSLENDYLLTAGIYGGRYGTGAHAISLWGYETDDLSGDLIGLWIGDSDSEDAGNVLVDIVWNDELSRWYLTSENYADWYIDDITQFVAPVIPEPLYGAFALGGIALALAVYRRRSKAAAAGQA